MVVVGGCLAIANLDHTDSTPTAKSATTPSVSTATQTLELDAQPAVVGEGQCRTDPGDQNSGPGVIAAFEHAYFVNRSGAAVRALATPTTSLPAVEKIQAGIDTVPPGSTYCVRINPMAEDMFMAVVTETEPDQGPVHPLDRHHQSDRRPLVRRRPQQVTQTPASTTNRRPAKDPNR